MVNVWLIIIYILLDVECSKPYTQPNRYNITILCNFDVEKYLIDVT